MNRIKCTAKKNEEKKGKQENDRKALFIAIL